MRLNPSDGHPPLERPEESTCWRSLAQARDPSWRKPGMLFANRSPMLGTHRQDVSSQRPWFSAARADDSAADLRAVAGSALATDNAHEAIAALRMAAEYAPNDVELLLSLGVLLAQKGLYSEAQDTFMRVLDLDATNLDAFVNLGQLCRAGRHFVEAVDLLEHARRCHGDVPLVIGALTAVAIDLGDEDGAIRLLVHLERTNPDFVELPLLMRRLATMRVRQRAAVPQ